MNFSTANKLRDTIAASDEVERIRGLNRVKIQELANGTPPLTEQEATKMGYKINVNWLSATVLFANARRQFQKAFGGASTFFKINIPDAPPEKATDWSIWVTNKINRYLKNSRDYFFLRSQKFASLILHGIGPSVWFDDDTILPKYIAIEDVRLPTDSMSDLSNCEWFAIRVASTEGQLSQKVFGPNAAKGWNKKAVAKLLHAYRNQNYTDAGANFSWLLQPEKLSELVRQNAGFYSSDAVPTISLFHAYIKEKHNGRDVWMLRVIPDWNVAGTSSIPEDEFLFYEETPFAEELNRILHLQVADLNSKAPFLYHSIRSLGFLLMEPCWWDNLVRCRSLQHLFDGLNCWWKVIDPAGRARAQNISMGQNAIIPEGVSIVPASERHQIDSNLMEFFTAQFRQLINEASGSYTSASATENSREQTAYETSVKLSQVTAMTEGLLLAAAFQEQFAYREICRRFCLRNSTDPAAKQFQEDCTKKGIPKLWINENLWDIDVNIPMGAGNPAVAMSEAKQLLELRPMYGPSAQSQILHEATAVITGDPGKAERWVPLDDTFHVSDAMRDAEFAFGTLMQGVPVRMKEGLSAMEQIETLLGLLAGVISRIEQQDNLGTAGEVLGLSTVGSYINQLIQQVAQDQSEKARVKEYSDTLGKLMNSVKGFQQRLQEEQTKPAQPDPEQIAKAQATTMQAQTKMAISERSAQQKQAHKDVALQKEQQRRDAQTAAEIQRENLKTGAELGRENVKTGAEMHREGAKAGSEIAREHVKTKADIANTKKVAAAKPKAEKKP